MPVTRSGAGGGASPVLGTSPGGSPRATSSGGTSGATPGAVDTFTGTGLIKATALIHEDYTGDFLAWSRTVESAFTIVDLGDALTVMDHPATKKVYAALFLKLSPSYKTYVAARVTDPNAAELWSTLKSEFKDRSKLQANELRASLISFEMNPGESIGDYSLRLTTLKSKLEAANVKVDDAMLSFHLINGLPSDYSVLKTLITHAETTFDEAVAMLKTEETSLARSRPAMHGYGGKALSLKTNNRGAPHGRPGADSPPFADDDNGDGDAGRDNDGGKTSKKPVIECYYCRAKGHTIRECRKLKAIEAKAAAASGDSSDKPLHLMLMSNVEPAY